jgi:hypothetical protein
VLWWQAIRVAFGPSFAAAHGAVANGRKARSAGAAGRREERRCLSGERRVSRVGVATGGAPDAAGSQMGSDDLTAKRGAGSGVVGGFTPQIA